MGIWPLTPVCQSSRFPPAPFCQKKLSLSLSLPLSLFLSLSTMNNNKKKRLTTPANPNPRKPMQAFHFLRSLSRISLTVPFHKRCRAIRRAAYASMARSASPSRAWKHAVLSHLRRRRRAHPVPVLARAPRKDAHQHDALRRVLPGGKSMDSCRLLEETIDYVRCLRTQVKLMQEMVDSHDVEVDGIEERRLKEGN